MDFGKFLFPLIFLSSLLSGDPINDPPNIAVQLSGQPCELEITAEALLKEAPQYYDRRCEGDLIKYFQWRWGFLVLLAPEAVDWIPEENPPFSPPLVVILPPKGEPPPDNEPELIPEPSTLALIVGGGLVLIFRKR